MQSTHTAPSAGQPEMVLQLGHLYGVTSIAFASNGQTFASTSRDGTVKLWDVETGSLKRTLDTPEVDDTQEDDLWSVAFSPDAETVAAGGTGKILVWDSETGALKQVLARRGGSIISLAFTSDGRRLAATGGASTLRIWDVETGKPRLVRMGSSAIVESVRLFKDGSLLGAGREGNTAVLWDAESGQVTLKFDLVCAQPTLSMDGLSLAGLVEENVVKVWDVPTGRERFVLRLERMVTCLAFTADSRTLATVSLDYTVRLWDLGSGTLKQTLTKDWVQEMAVVAAFSPGGDVLAWGSVFGTVSLWDVKTGALRSYCGSRYSSISSLAFSKDGRSLIHDRRDHGSVRGGDTVQVWDIVRGQLVQSLRSHTNMFYTFALSSGGGEWTSGSYGETTLWDTSTGKVMATLTGYHSMLEKLTFSQDGKTLGGYDAYGSVMIWDLTTGALKTTMKANGLWDVTAVALSPDGKVLARATRTRTIELWDLATETLMLTLGPHSEKIVSVAFAPDGNTLAARDGAVRVWDLKTAQLKHLLSSRAAVCSLAYSPDSHTVAAGLNDGTITIWNVQTGKLERVLPGHEAIAKALAFSADGRMLASGSYDSTTKIWHLESGRLLATLVEFPLHRTERQNAEWMILTPEGYYHGSSGSEHYIRWRIGGKLLSTDRFENTFHRPDLVQRALTGETLPVP